MTEIPAEVEKELQTLLDLAVLHQLDRGQVWLFEQMLKVKASGEPAAMATDHYTIERMQREWEYHLQALGRDDYDDPGKRLMAFQWVLVNVFGNERKFLYDPLFHAQVTMAVHRIDFLIGAQKRP